MVKKGTTTPNPANIDELLVKERDFISAILETTGALMIVFDHQGRFLRINNTFEKLTGFSILDLVGKTFWETLLTKEESSHIQKVMKQALRINTPQEYQAGIITREGQRRTIVWSFTSLMRENKESQFIIASGIDVTKLRQLEEEREKIIEELQAALTKVKTLSGLFPICSGCKKIRDDKGYWNQIEEYIQKYSEVEFSHSLCPECVKSLYPDYYQKRKKNKTKKGGKVQKK